MNNAILNFFLISCVFKILVLTLNRDFYSILKISTTSTEFQIKQSYRRLAKELHPDKNPKDENAQNKFQDLTEAYEVLSNPEKRKLYDRCGESCVTTDGQNFGSFFNNYDFDTPGFIKRHKDNYYYFDDGRGPNLEMEIFFTLEEFYNGHVIEIIRETFVAKPIPGKTIKCNCRPEYVPQPFHDNIYKVKEEIVCDECDSFEFERQDISLDVVVKSGMLDGQAILFSGYGELDFDVGNKPGDLIVELRELKHSRFCRLENDLYINATISLQNALNGFEFSLKHLDGHMVHIEHDKITQPGDKIVIENEGMPIYNTKLKGELHITFDVEFPKRKLTQNQKQQIGMILRQPTQIKFYNGS